MSGFSPLFFGATVATKELVRHGSEPLQGFSPLFFGATVATFSGASPDGHVADSEFQSPLLRGNGRDLNKEDHGRLSIVFQSPLLRGNGRD